ncbi:MAG TPA: hypothetical protein VHA13_03765, partial [Gammaproteobacteria bacterium]|nr:hypothetical protein [Gammaproteobacteria bacterium]
MGIFDNRPSCASDEDELSISTFAHIHHDERLLGSHLQGNTFKSTVGYLLRFMEYIEKNHCDMSEQEKSIITQALVNTKPYFQDLINKEKEIKILIGKTNQEFASQEKLSSSNNYYRSGAELQHRAKLYETLLDQKIKTLADGIIQPWLKDTAQDLFIPGGWSGSPGHAMCYQLQKKDDGSYAFLIYNTGAGMNFHASKAGFQRLYSPVKVFELPTGTDITSLVQLLLKPQIKPNISYLAQVKYNEHIVYGDIEKEIQRLKAKEVAPASYFNEYILPQLSGTCSMRVLMPVLQNAMKNTPKAFSEYLYQLELQSLLDLFRIEKQKDNLSAPIVQNQLRAALSRFARSTRQLMRNPKDSPVLSEERAHSSLELIDQMNRELKKHEKMETINVLELEKALENTLQRSTTWQKELQNQAIALLPVDMRLDEAKKLSPEIVPTYEKQNVLEYLNRCNRVFVHNDKLLLSDQILRDVEQLFLTLPISGKKAKEFWGSLSPDESRLALDYVQNITFLYGKHCYLKGGDPLPKRVATSLTGMLMASHIANVYFEGHADFKYLADFLNADKHFADKKAKKIRDPYSVTFDPIFDERIAEINEEFNLILNDMLNVRSMFYDYESYYNNSIRKDQSAAVDYYDVELINKHDKQEALLEWASHNNVPRHGTRMDCARIALYDLANRRAAGKLTMDENKLFGPLLKDFDFCIQFHEYYHECLLFERGGFSYFKNNKSSEADRLANVSFDELDYERDIRGKYENMKSKVGYQNGVLGGYNGRRVRSSKTVTLSEVYGLDNGLINDALFSDSIVSQYGFTQRDRQPDEGYDSNAALLHFATFNKSQLSNGEFYHTLPFTRTRQSILKVVVTLDFFKQNIDKLNDFQYQNLFLINLLTPTLLQALDANPMIATDLVTLLDRLFIQNSNAHRVDPPAMFALRAAGLFYRYLSAYSHEMTDKVKLILKENQTHLEKFLPQLRQSLATARADKNDKLILELSRLYLFLTAEFINEDHDLNKANIIEILKTNFSRNKISGHQSFTDNVFFSDELANDLAKIFPYLTKNFNQLSRTDQEDMLKEMIKSYPLNTIFPEGLVIDSLDINFPEIIINHSLFLDFKSGTVKGLNFSIGYVPNEFYNQDFRDFFGDRLILAKTNLDAKIPYCEFYDNNHYYRVLRDEKGITHIQRAMGFDQDKRWYELQDIDHIYDKSTIRDLPRHFFENGKYFWSDAANADCYVTNAKGGSQIKIIKKAINSYSHELEFCEVNDSGQLTGFSLKPPMDPPRVSYIMWLPELPQGSPWDEDSFWHELPGAGLLRTNEGIYYISKMGSSPFDISAADLAKMDSFFDVDKLKNSKKNQRFFSQTDLSKLQSLLYPTIYDAFTHFESSGFIEVWAQESQIKINLPRYNLSFLAHKTANNNWEIILASNPELKMNINGIPSSAEFSHGLYFESATERRCIFPMQEFYSTGEDNAEYHQLDLDKENKIPTDILHDNHQSLDARDVKWTFSNSKKYYSFQVDADGNCVATNPEECLYLCYLSLGSYQEEKAYRYLLQCEKLGGLTGNQAEIELIKKIMLEIPNPQSKSYNNSRITTPEVSAVRLQAATLLSEFKLKQFDAPLSLKNVPEKSVNNALYHNVKNKLLTEFYEEKFYAAAIENYEYYMKVRPHVPKAMRLNSDHERLLLKILFKSKGRDDLTVEFINRYRQLKIYSLKERKKLLLKKMATTLDEGSLQDLQEKLVKIENKITKNSQYTEQVLDQNPETTPSLVPEEKYIPPHQYKNETNQKSLCSELQIEFSVPPTQDMEFKIENVVIEQMDEKFVQNETTKFNQ